MSYSDFLILLGANNTASSVTGSSVLNSSLSFPLTSSVQCRVCDPALITGHTQGNFYISSSVSSSAFINIPETKSISLRIWGRATYFNGNAFALVAKTNPPNNYTNGSANGSLPNCGYEFGYNASGDKLYVSYGGYKYSRTSSDVKTGIGCHDKWIGLRMDIVPVRVNKIINGIPVSGTLKDIVSLYTASFSSPDTWVNVLTNEILTTNNVYVPWGSFTTGPGASPGANQLVNQSSCGFVIDSNSVIGNDRVYFDDFQIYVKDAF